MDASKKARTELDRLAQEAAVARGRPQDYHELRSHLFEAALHKAQAQGLTKMDLQHVEEAYAELPPARSPVARPLLFGTMALLIWLPLWWATGEVELRDFWGLLVLPLGGLLAVVLAILRKKYSGVGSAGLAIATFLLLSGILSTLQPSGVNPTRFHNFLHFALEQAKPLLFWGLAASPFALLWLHSKRILALGGSLVAASAFTALLVQSGDPLSQVVAGGVWLFTACMIVVWGLLLAPFLRIAHGRRHPPA